MHSHRNLLLPGAVAAASGTYGPELRQGVLLPLTILNLMVLGPLVAFQDGSALVCMDRIDAARRRGVGARASGSATSPRCRRSSTTC